MSKQKGVRTGARKQKQTASQIQLTEKRRDEMEGVNTLDGRSIVPGPAPGKTDFGTDDETGGDDIIVDDDDTTCSAEPGFLEGGSDEEPSSHPSLTTADLLGSRPAVVLFRLSCDGDEIAVRSCAPPGTSRGTQALELLAEVVRRCFQKGRDHCNDAEWAELLGQTPASLTRRLTLLLRLAIRADESLGLGKREEEKSEARFTPHDIGLERFANKFAALPDGTPFSIRLLLLDQRGRERSDHFFDQLPEAVKLLAMKKALRKERERGVAVSDNEFRDDLQQVLEELLGMPVPKPTEDQVRRRLRDNFKRKGLGDLFPNQRERQRAYDQAHAAALTPGEEPA